MADYIIQIDLGADWNDIKVADAATIMPRLEFHQANPPKGSVNTFRLTDKHIYLSRDAAYTTKLTLQIRTAASTWDVDVAHGFSGQLTITPVGGMPTTVAPSNTPVRVQVDLP